MFHFFWPRSGEAKDEAAASDALVPSDSSSPPPVRRKRGRPPGTPNSAKKTPAVTRTRTRARAATAGQSSRPVKPLPRKEAKYWTYETGSSDEDEDAAASSDGQRKAKGAEGRAKDAEDADERPFKRARFWHFDGVDVNASPRVSTRATKEPSTARHNTDGVSGILRHPERPQSPTPRRGRGRPRKVVQDEPGIPRTRARLSGADERADETPRRDRPRKSAPSQSTREMRSSGIDTEPSTPSLRPRNAAPSTVPAKGTVSTPRTSASKAAPSTTPRRGRPRKSSPVVELPAASRSTPSTTAPPRRGRPRKSSPVVELPASHTPSQAGPPRRGRPRKSVPETSDEVPPPSRFWTYEPASDSESELEPSPPPPKKATPKTKASTAKSQPSPRRPGRPRKSLPEEPHAPSSSKFWTYKPVATRSRRK